MTSKTIGGSNSSSVLLASLPCIHYLPACMIMYVLLTKYVREGASYAARYAGSRASNTGLRYPLACTGGDSETALGVIGKATTGDEPELAVWMAGADTTKARERRRQLRHCSVLSPPPPKATSPPRSRFSHGPSSFFFASNRAFNVGNLTD